MKRREALVSFTSLPVLIAGCLSVSNGSDTKTEFSTKQSNHSCEAPAVAPDSRDIPFRVQSAVDNAEDKVRSVAAITDQPTEENPGKLVIAVQNVTDRAQTIQFGSVPPFSGLKLEHRDTDDSLLLVPNPLVDSVSVSDLNDDGEFSIIPDTKTDGCWIGKDLPYAESYFESVDPQPCESDRNEFLILSDPTNDRCYSDGVYERTDEGKIQNGEVTFSLDVKITVSE